MITPMMRAAGAAAEPPTPGTPEQARKSLASQDTFMKLLVAQLRNQNPLQPTEGVEFVAQLAQFTDLEQSIGMRDDLKKIRQMLEGLSLGEPESGTQSTGGQN